MSDETDGVLRQSPVFSSEQPRGFFLTWSVYIFLLFCPVFKHGDRAVFEMRSG